MLHNVKQHPVIDVFPSIEIMSFFMDKALKQAERSYQHAEVPVGAIVVLNNEIIAESHNLCLTNHDISHHAEILALGKAGKVLSNYRLNNCDVYVTLEPCIMCASALIQARVRRVIYGAAEPKMGAAGSLVNLFNNININKHTAFIGGIKETECKILMQQFFKGKR